VHDGAVHLAFFAPGSAGKSDLLRRGPITHILSRRRAEKPNKTGEGKAQTADPESGIAKVERRHHNGLMACRVIRINSRPRRAAAPARTLASEVARMILDRWGYPFTPGNLDAIESAAAVPIEQLQHLSASLPRWICSAGPDPVGQRIAEVNA
jgi:hypothetical protein